MTTETLQQTPMYDSGAAEEEPAERLLWVYRTHSAWSKDPRSDCSDCEGTGVRSGPTEKEHAAPCHCIRNSVGGTLGLKEPRDFDDILAENTREKVLSELRTPIDPATVWDFQTEVRLLVRETWYLTWFQHQQPDWGDSDQEVLDNFQNYVFRIQRFNERNMCVADNGYTHEPFCLMGAEDRWRWRNADDEKNKPCRCAGCKKFGIVRIDH